MNNNHDMENKIEQTKKIYKATLEAVAKESCELEYDMDTVLNGISLAVATFFAAYNEYDGDFTIDMMAEDFKNRVVRSYNAIQRVE